MESSAVFAVRCPKHADRLSLLDEVSAARCGSRRAPNGRGRYNRACFGIHTLLLRLPELTLLQLGQTILCLARVR